MSPDDAPDDDDDDNNGDEPDNPEELEKPQEPEEAEEPEEPFVPLGSEEPPPATTVTEPIDAHAAIARSLYSAPGLPRVLRKEARAFFDGAMYAYTEGDLPGARLSFLAVAAIGDPDTAPAALVFLGVIAYRRRDVPEARMWFTRAASGHDQHWALVATGELRRLG
ncbi:hypothetical protein [Catenulispora rubra]|uniref:hypothetical protein n=1 Tax=Catenulispora rubra TaxID=280293 RepID=UPI0018922084|nr:hypothetical protein [Catenulispora rubra]